MTIEQFKTALRALCAENLEAMRVLVASFQQKLAEIETAAKASVGADHELISTVLAMEVKRYAAELDKL